MPQDQLRQFESVILPHLDAAYTLARYLLRDEHDAQDAVQDAALRAFRHFATYRGGDARAWFLTVVRNACFSAMRARRTEPANPDLAIDASMAVEPRATDALAIEQSEMDAVRRAVAALPVEFREVVVLRELHEMSYAEISTIVEVPIGTVMSRLSRGRRLLAQQLGGIKEIG